MQVSEAQSHAIVVRPVLDVAPESCTSTDDAPAFTRTGYALEAHKRPVTSVSFLRTAPLLLTASADRSALLWDLKEERLPAVLALRAAKAALTDAALLESHCLAALCDASGEIHLHQLADGKRVARMKSAIRTTCNAVSAIDEHLVACVANDKSLCVWDVREHRKSVLQAVVSCPALDVANVREGVIATAALDGAIRLHDLRSIAAPMCITRHQGHAVAVAGDQHGARIVSQGADGVRLCDVRAYTGVPTAKQRLLAHDNTSVVPFEARLPRVAWSQHGVATAGADGILRVWNTADETLELVCEHEKRAAPLSDVAFHPTFDAIATAAEDGSVHLSPVGVNIASL